MRYRTVIFDVDGTLLDSNDAHAQAWVEALTVYGHGVSFEQVRPLIGKGGDKVLPELTGVEADSAEGKALSAHRQQLFRTRYLPDLSATPGAVQLLTHLREKGHTLLVASSAEAKDLKASLDILGANDLIEHQASSADAERSKPDPDIVRGALKRAGRDPHESIMVGDTPYDIQAARGCDVPTIALLCGGWNRTALTGAVAIYTDPADLLARYDSSVLAR